MHNYNKKIISTILPLFIFVVFLFPLFSHAKLALDCGADANAKMCTVDDVFTLINVVIKFLLTDIILPLIIIILSYCGFLFLTSGGNTETKTKAKTIAFNVVKGLALILFSWIIVYTIFKAFGYSGETGLKGKLDWRVNTSGWNIGANTNTNTTTDTTSYVVTVNETSDINDTDPTNTIITVHVLPKAVIDILFNITCTPFGGPALAPTLSKIDANTTSTFATLKLEPQTNYTCNIASSTHPSFTKTFSFTTGSVVVTADPVPSTPTNFIATGGNQQITLSWTPPSEKITGYTIQYGTTPGIYTHSSVHQDPNETGTHIVGLDSKTHYYFSLVANNGNSKSVEVLDEATTL